MDIKVGVQCQNLQAYICLVLLHIISINVHMTHIKVLLVPFLLAERHTHMRDVKRLIEIMII